MTDKNKTKYDLTDDGKGKKYDTGKSMVGMPCIPPCATWCREVYRVRDS